MFAAKAAPTISKGLCDCSYKTLLIYFTPLYNKHLHQTQPIEMALIVQKYGGTSVGTIENIGKVADKVCAQAKAGDKIVVAVSAMSGATNRLLAIPDEVIRNTHHRKRK